MVRRVSQSLVAWFLLWDLALTAGAWVLAYYVRFHSGLFSAHRGVPAPILYVRALPLVLLVGMVAFRLAGMYEVHRLRRFREELGAVAKGVALLALFVMATSFARGRHFANSRPAGAGTTRSFGDANTTAGARTSLRRETRSRSRRSRHRCP